MGEQQSVSAFERLARSTAVADICTEVQECWDVVPGSQLAPALRRLLEDAHPSRDFQKPILLRAKLHSDSGMPLFHGTFPFGVLFPDRALLAAIDRSAGGERFVDWDVLDDEYLDNGAGRSVAEFQERSLLCGQGTLWDLLTDAAIQLSREAVGLVLLGGGHYGVLTIDELLNSAGAKSCWLTLTLDLERAALELCKQRPREALAAIEGDRHEAARERLILRFAHAGKRGPEWWVAQFNRAHASTFLGQAGDFHTVEPLILDHTLFSDKKSMLMQGGFELGISKSQVKRLFEQAEKLRNWCAHPSTEPEVDFPSLSQLRRFVMEVHSFAQQLRALARAATPHGTGPGDKAE